MNFRPISDNVLVELEPLPTVSPGGIHLAITCAKCGGRGKVLERGTLARCMSCGGGGVGKNETRGSRFGRVLLSGPGYYAQTRGEANSTVEQPRRFISNETRAGDRVLLDAQAGQVWDGELSVPRHNPGNEFGELLGISGELRIVREAEIHCILEDDGRS